MWKGKSKKTKIKKDLKEQVEYLKKQIREEPGIDLKNDWKVVNILIGANVLKT
jgi:hypothetical protein